MCTTDTLPSALGLIGANGGDEAVIGDEESNGRAAVILTRVRELHSVETWWNLAEMIMIWKSVPRLHQWFEGTMGASLAIPRYLGREGRV